MDDLRLALYRGSSAETIAVADVLALDDAARATLDVSPSWCTFSLVVDGEERWGARLSLGALGPLVEQLPQAADRLERGEPAVVRAAVFDVPIATFLVFEPGGDDVVASLAASTQLSDPIWMPTPAMSERLYTFVGQHRGELAAAAREQTDLEPQRLHRAAAIAALHREARLGARAVALLGTGQY